MKSTPSLPYGLVAAAALAWMPIAQSQESPASTAPTAPPPVENLEQQATSATPSAEAPKASNFRYSYPVRDSGSAQVYTEKKAPVQTPVKTHAPTDSQANMPVFETVGGDDVLPAPDMREGIFSKRPYRISFAVYEGYNSNVNTQQDNGVASMYTQISGGISYDFGSPRLELNTSLSAALTYYYNQEGLDNDGLFPTVYLVIGANYAATPKLNLSFSTSTGLLSAGNYTTPGAPNSFQGSYILSDSILGATYRWAPKFSTVTSYNPRIYYFVDQDYNDGQGRVEQTVSQQFQYLWKPTTKLVAEYRFDTRNYYQPNNLNSIGNYALLGFDHTLNPRASVMLRAGAEQRFNQNPVTGAQGNSSDNTYIGPFAQFNANYAVGKGTTVGLQSRYGTTASGLSNYNQGQQFLLGLNAAHQFTRRISASLFFNYQNNFYDQPDSVVNGVEVSPDFTANVFNTGLNATFAINRMWSLLAGYTFTTSMSSDTVQMRDYTQNIAYIGTQVTF